jgi:hypothetical protein
MREYGASMANGFHGGGMAEQYRAIPQTCTWGRTEKRKDALGSAQVKTNQVTASKSSPNRSMETSGAGHGRRRHVIVLHVAGARPAVPEED